MRFTEQTGLLCIDDELLDLELIAISLQGAGFRNPIYQACNGVEALRMLRGKWELVSRPEVVFLDLNMPGMGGHEFLECIRKDAELQLLTVFVLTTSDLEKDVRLAYRQRVAGYLVKPFAIDEMFSMFEQLRGLLQLMALPYREESRLTQAHS